VILMLLSGSVLFSVHLLSPLHQATAYRSLFALPVPQRVTMVTGSFTGMACLIIRIGWLAWEQRSVSLPFAQGQQGVPPVQHTAGTALHTLTGGADKVACSCAARGILLHCDAHSSVCVCA
jgi:hypothetical protein